MSKVLNPSGKHLCILIYISSYFMYVIVFNL